MTKAKMIIICVLLLAILVFVFVNIAAVANTRSFYRFIDTIPTVVPDWVHTATYAPTPTPAPTPSPTPVPEPTNTPDDTFRQGIDFKAENMDIWGLYIGMNIDDAEKIIGPYNSKKTYDNYASIGAYGHSCKYDFGRVSYCQDVEDTIGKSWISYICIKDSDKAGPAGIKIGDSTDEVIAKLGIPNEYFERLQHEIYNGDEYLGWIYYNADDSVEEIVLTVLDGCATSYGVVFENGIVSYYYLYEQLN